VDLKDLLNNIEEGKHNACRGCPWNPKHSSGSAFGVSCIKHGFDWQNPGSALSVLIARDPGGTTPEKTGILCGYCNSKFTTDHSAQHGLSLWRAAVSLAESGPDETKFMKQHYWMNAVMHGGKDNQLEVARTHCTQILLEQINSLSPQVIITTGKDASQSLFELKLITRRWDEFKDDFSNHPYCEEVTLSSGKRAIVFCTYHGSATAVNTHIARKYSESTEDYLNNKIKRLPNPKPAQNFMKRTSGLNGEQKGMRVLLLHWLEIGEAIRQANAKL
jgi:hypothetical protein